MKDYTSFKKTNDDDLAKLAKLAKEQLDAEVALASAEKEVERAKKELRDIADVKIPELMDKVGMEEFRTRSGLKISIKENIRARISKNNAEQAFAWLREHGHDALIKRKIVAEFGKGEDVEASEISKLLEERELQITDDSSVHTSTLAKFVREKLEAGEDIPMELFGVHRQRSATVTV